MGDQHHSREGQKAVAGATVKIKKGRLPDLITTTELPGQVLRFVLAGGGVALISVFAYGLCAIVLGIPPMIANVIAQALNLVLGFHAHRIWSFIGRKGENGVHAAFGRYCVVSLAALLLNTCWIGILIDLLRQSAWTPIIPMIIATPAMTFMLNRHWTFRAKTPAHSSVGPTLH